MVRLSSSKDEMLLIRGDAFFVLNPALSVVDRVRGLNFQGNCFAWKSLNRDLHTSMEANDKVPSGCYSQTGCECPRQLLEPFSCEDKALLPAGWEEYYLHRGEGQDEG